MTLKLKIQYLDQQVHVLHSLSELKHSLFRSRESRWLVNLEWNCLIRCKRRTEGKEVEKRHLASEKVEVLSCGAQSE